MHTKRLNIAVVEYMYFVIGASAIEVYYLFIQYGIVLEVQ